MDVGANLPGKIRDSVELTIEAVASQMDEAKTQEIAEAPNNPAPAQSLKSNLRTDLSGISQAELALVERSQDSLQVTKKRMERMEQERSARSMDSDASCDTSGGPKVVCRSTHKQKRAKTRFFIAGETSVPARPERKSVGRRISEVFGMKGKREEGKAEEVEGHVKFEKFPEIID